jgi:hypothetical protein
MPEIKGFAFLERLGFDEEMAEKIMKLKGEYMVTKTKVIPIHWLEHPFKYDYLRKRYYQSMYRRYFRKGQKVLGGAAPGLRLRQQP